MTGRAAAHHHAPAFPSLPAAVARVLAAVQDESCSTAELIRVLEPDPGLCARLLRLANSAYYGLPRDVESLPRAVLVLGRTTVFAVALAATLLRRPSGAVPAPEVEGLWTHAYACALGCRHLGDRLPPAASRSAPEGLFLLGLLHDLGKIAFLARDPEGYPELLRDRPGPDLRAQEAERYGWDHAEEGGEVLDGWKLPPRLTAAVRYHHRGGLRAELRPDGDVLAAVQAVLRGAEPEPGPALAPGLLADLAVYLPRAQADADAFYRAVV